MQITETAIQMLRLPLAVIAPDPQQPRWHFDENALRDLADWAQEFFDRLRDPDEWNDPVTRDEVRNAVNQCVEATKRREQAKEQERQRAAREAAEQARALAAKATEKAA